jgi:ketosteroid isomerase-like protein
MPRRLERVLTVSAVVGVSVFGLLEAAQSALRSDHPFSAPMSDYAVGSGGYVQTVGFVLLAVGSMALCADLALYVRSTTGFARSPLDGWVAGVALLGVWSAGVLVAAIFPVGTAATLHSSASFLSFVAVVAAMFVLADTAGGLPRFEGLRQWSWRAAAVATASLLVGGATQPSVVFGVFQRVFVGTVLIWLVYLAVWLDRLVRTRLVDQLWHALGAFNEGDLGSLIELLDPAVEWHGLDGVQIEACRSRDEVVANLCGHFEGGFRLRDLEVTEVDRHLVVGFRAPPGVPSRGGRIYNLFSVRDGKIVRIQDYDRKDRAIDDVRIQ